MRSRLLLAAATLLVGLGAGADAAPENTCLACHSTLQDARLSTPTTLFRETDVHRDRGFACADCHGGDPSAAEKASAHGTARGFKGAPRGQAQIAVCARCHSDAALMRKYSPRQRVDQATEYATSVHGKRLASGDTNVATCASCHGAHGIRVVSDARSPVYPTNVATTCAACHADAKRMSGYKLADGSALPTNQFAEYQKSVHYAAMTKRNDLSAATCNDCHGNHGATPPGVDSIANVCGACHAVFAQKFQLSTHADVLSRKCVDCHGNHAVLQPSDDMVGSSGHALCADCHSKDDKGGRLADTLHGQFAGLKQGIDDARTLVARVRDAGIEVSDAELALLEASTKLTLARTEMHAADKANVDPIVADGLKLVASAEKTGQDGVRELRYRRRGLAISLALILLLVVALALKVRQLDARARR